MIVKRKNKKMKLNLLKQTVSGILILSLCVLSGCSNERKSEESDSHVSYESLTKKVSVEHNAKLKVWYTDDEDDQLLTEASEAFEEKYGVKIKIEKKPAEDYLENINKYSKKDKGADVYLLGHDQLKKANMAGLAMPVTLLNKEFFEDNYPGVALRAASLSDGIYGYPLYFDTYFLVYDSSVVKQIPRTIDDILKFTEDHSDQNDTRSIFKWDLSDPYYNYMFLGAYANVFGETGDDNKQFSVNTEETIKGMEYFQSLNEYLFGSVTNSSYQAVEEAIKEEKTVFSICKTDILSILENENTSYKIAPLPDLTPQLKSKGLSSTKLAVINAYSKQEQLAQLFASFISYEYAEQIYDLTGKLSARLDSAMEEDNLIQIYRQYRNSIPVPKALEMGDFWSNLAIAQQNIWNGANVRNQLDGMQKRMDKRLAAK